jgi:hypothetical protein
MPRQTQCKWEQAVFLHDPSLTPRQLSTWATVIVNSMLQYTTNLWHHRNTIVHGSTV